MMSSDWKFLDLAEIPQGIGHEIQQVWPGSDISYDLDDQHIVHSWTTRQLAFRVLHNSTMLEVFTPTGEICEHEFVTNYMYRSAYDPNTDKLSVKRVMECTELFKIFLSDKSVID